LTRIIRRYPNRRLYDTEQSRYVSLDDLKELVLKTISFEVRDSKTHENITRTVLLQILFDQESQSTPLFSDTLLRSFICFYSHPLGVSNIAPFLEKSLEAFHTWTASAPTPVQASPLPSPTSWNPWLSWWENFQEYQPSQHAKKDSSSK
jgi:polyhydroxyalkanoate synthesis repressor PhaR